MDCKVATANHWSKIAIGAAIEVHRLKGAGLLESIYEKCLARELQLREVPTVRQFQIRFEYLLLKPFPSFCYLIYFWRNNRRIGRGF